MTNRVKNAALGSGRSQFDPEEAVQNALIADAELPAIQIADRLAHEAPEEFKIDAARKSFLRRICAIRRTEERAKHEQYSLSGMDHLPLRIVGHHQKGTVLLEATFRSVEAYVNRVNASRQDTVKQREAKALLEFMREASKKQRGITVKRAIELYGPIPPIESAGHVAKRPASSRKPAAKKAKAK